MVNKIYGQDKDLMVRISEIEIDSIYLDEYKVILKTEAQALVDHVFRSNSTR